MSLGSAEVLALTGMMGSGKSATAQALAQLTGRQVFSVDAEISRRAGKPIAAIFAEDGEPAFRALERQVLAAIPAGAIADLGGGAFCQPANAERLLAAGRVVFLEVSAAEAARLPFYRRAHLTVATDGLSPQAVARRILEAL